MAASMVMNRARNSVSCARPTTHCVNTMPSPESVTTPIMMPAEAQASATASEFLAPSAIASMILVSVTLTRVDLRSAATGKQASVPASAASGAL